MNIVRAFFPKSVHSLLNFFKKQGKPSPISPLVRHLNTYPFLFSFFTERLKEAQNESFFFLSTSLKIYIENWKFTANQGTAKHFFSSIFSFLGIQLECHYTRNRRTSYLYFFTQCHIETKFEVFLQISFANFFELEWIKLILLFVDYISLYFLLLDLLAISSSACRDNNKYALFTDIINFKK